MRKGSQAVLKPLRDRMEKHIDRKPTGCWHWLGSTDRNGYGQVRSGGRAPKCGKLLYTHRAMWELTNGPVPDGLYLLHQCDNPICCNPAHLRVGTQADNINEAAARGRFPRGTRHWNAKIDETTVRAVRAASGTQREIAKMFNISQQSVGGIKRGLSWSWLK